MEKPRLIQDLGTIRTNPQNKINHHYGLFECPYCKISFRARIDSVKDGHTTSCGCYIRSVTSKRSINNSYSETHGLSHTKIYASWARMKRRCYNPNDISYKDYGGRGITVCDEWKNNFMSYYSWAITHGYSDQLEPDRQDNDGDYKPSNCRFSNGAVQSQNSRLLRSTNTSGYRGVSWHKGSNKWRTAIRCNDKVYWLGRFDTKEQAAQAYNDFVIANKTEHPLNIIPNK